MRARGCYEPVVVRCNLLRPKTILTEKRFPVFILAVVARLWSVAMIQTFSPILRCIATFIATTNLVALAQAPSLRLLTSTPPISVGLSVLPGTTNWVLVEASQDLTTWIPVVNLLTTNTTGPFVDHPPPDAVARFYRARSPGVTVSEAQAVWDAQEPDHYDYSFQNSLLTEGGVLLAGTVSISNGVKTVTDVTKNGFPASTYDPDDFLTPSELFDLLARVEAWGVKLAHVTYITEWSLPATVAIVGGQEQPIAQYRISEFHERPEGAADTHSKSPPQMGSQLQVLSSTEPP